MNERIKELLTQAESDVDYIHLDKAINGELVQMYIPDCFAEQFAKLIVAECLDIVANADMTELEGPDPEDVLYVACKQIQEHFGVEE